MPTIREKIPVLGGRAVVLQYERNDDWYYREIIPGTKRYRTKLLKGIVNAADAVAAALDVFAQLRSVPAAVRPIAEWRVNESLTLAAPVVESRSQEASIPLGPSISSIATKKVSKASLTTLVNEFIQHEEGRCTAGLIKASTLKEKVNTLTKPFLAYLHSERIYTVDQLTDTVLDNYVVFRGDKTKLTRRKELIIIKDFIDNWLVRHKYLAFTIKTKKPRIKQSDLSANPSITPRDWKIINLHIRHRWIKEVKDHPNYRIHYWRTLFWVFTITMKNSGCRPNELLSLRWKDVEITDVGRYSKSKGITEERLIAYIRVTASKTGEQREIPCNLGNALRRWSQYQRAYVKKRNCSVEVTPNSLVFGNPHHELQAYTYPCYTRAWKQVLSGVSRQLEGNKFSDSNYTIYSMRSTFIEAHLAKGTDLYLLARMCGHSPTMLLKHYERLDIRNRSEEITHIDFGRKKTTTKTIDIFDI